MLNPETNFSLEANELIKQFQQQAGWEQRYRLVLQLAKQLPPLPPEAKQDENRIQGCESKVWLHHQRAGEQHFFSADSDTRIVKGLLAIIIGLSNGRTSAELSRLDTQTVLEQLQLHKHLSESRNNGINAVLVAIQELAKT